MGKKGGGGRRWEAVGEDTAREVGRRKTAGRLVEALMASMATVSSGMGRQRSSDGLLKPARTAALRGREKVGSPKGGTLVKGKEATGGSEGRVAQ